MTSDFRLHSERVPPTGAIGGPGALNALGRPGIDPWELFVRETIQNSWDARQTSLDGPVRFKVEARRMTSDQHAALLRQTITSLPPDGYPDQWDPIRDPEQHCLIVSDHGTTGLGGPTRADRDGDSPTDFVDFIWNVGQPPDKQRGGGTYGYGKGVLYRASQSATIVVHSRCQVDGREETRLIAAALGKPFDHSDGRKNTLHTGRHWWCIQESNRVLAPATDSLADELALSIGLPKRTRGDTGTTIMILAADLGEDPLDTMRQMAVATAWNCWPKIIAVQGKPDMQVAFSFEGGDIPVPDPRSHHDLREFVAAFETLTSGDSKSKVIEIASRRPKRKLGELALRRFVVPTASAAQSTARPFDGPAHHVALLRSPRLIVKYLPGPESATPGTAWSGVFLADDDADRDFAASEPPSHDDWAPQGVSDRRKKSAVTVALRSIRDATRNFVRPVIDDSVSENQPLGRLSDALGALLQSGAGTGTGVMPAPSSRKGRGKAGTGRAPRPVITVVREELLLVKGAPARRMQFTTAAANDSPATIVRPRVAVAINDGASVEQESPTDAEIPRVLGWETPDGESVFEDSIEVRSEDEGVWSVFVSAPRDAALMVSLEGEPRQ